MAGRRNSLARLTTVLSWMMIDPRLPMRISTTPFHPSSPARVTTNEGIFSFVISSPWMPPMPAPAPIATSSASAVGSADPSGNRSRAVSTPATPET